MNCPGKAPFLIECFSGKSELGGCPVGERRSSSSRPDAETIDLVPHPAAAWLYFQYAL